MKVNSDKLNERAYECRVIATKRLIDIRIKISWRIYKDMPDCPTCGKVFSDSTHLSRHLASKRACKAPGTTSTKCGDCDKLFSSISNLNKHRKIAHGVDAVNQITSIQGDNNNTNTTNITVHVNISSPKNFICPDIDFLEKMPAAKLKELIGDPPSPTMIAKLFSEIYLDESKPANHSVLLESLTSDSGYCFNEKWRRQATHALITQCASNTALKLADFEHIYESMLSKKNAKAVSDVCDTIEREDFTGELYKLLRDRITETLVEFTAKKTALLDVAKTEAKGPIRYPKSKTFEGWKEGGELRQAAIEAIRD